MIKIKHLGTYMPLVLFAGMMLAIASAHDGFLGWERPWVYQVTAASALLGAWALIQMAREPVGRLPSVFLLSLIYQKASLFVFWQTATIITYHVAPQPISSWWDIAAYGFLLDSSLCMAVVNIILFFGRKRGWLEAEADPVPLRSFLRRKQRSGKLSDAFKDKT